MMMRLLASTVVAFALALGAGCASAGDNPFLGTWTVTDVRVGDWVEPGTVGCERYSDSHTCVVKPEMQGAKLTFTATSVTAPAPLGCSNAVYELKTVGPEFLFEGGLRNPKADARALGFMTDTFPAMSFSCDRPDADISMDYAMADKNTVLFALDNWIYIMKRTPPK